MLHTPIYDQSYGQYCGPTAIAAVTGLPISQINRALREASGKSYTRGVHEEHLLNAMQMLGWDVAEHVKTDYIPKDIRGPGVRLDARREVFRLEDFFEEHGTRGPFILTVRLHYIAVSQGEACDTYTKLPIPLDRWRRGRQRWVQEWWRFSKSNET